MILLPLAAIVIGSASMTLSNATTLLYLIDLIREIEHIIHGETQ